MSDYTPTTEEVRSEALSDSPSSIRPAEFDRWLFHIQEDAWDRGYQAGIVDSPYISPRIILTAKEVEQLNKALDREEDA